MVTATKHIYKAEITGTIVIKGVSYRGAPLYLHDSRPVIVTCHSLLLSTYTHTGSSAAATCSSKARHPVPQRTVGNIKTVLKYV